jgi:hypothetical protein
MDIALQAMEQVFSYKYEEWQPHPADEETFNGQGAYLLKSDIQGIFNMWTQFIEYLSNHPVENMSSIRKIVWAWSHPDIFYTSPDPELEKMLDSYAKIMLRNVVSMARQHLGEMHWAKQIAKRLNSRVRIPIEEDFLILYPIENSRENYLTQEKRHYRNAEALANRWALHLPSEVVPTLVRYIIEAEVSEINHPRFDRFIFERIADQSKRPMDWVKELLNAKVKGHFIQPFLERLANLRDPEVIDVFKECLARKETRRAAAMVVITSPSLHEELLSRVLDHPEVLAGIIRQACQATGLEETCLKKLLLHENKEIAISAATGEWYAKPASSIREDLFQEWRRVIVEKSVFDDTMLESVFKKYPGIAYQWLLARIEEQADVLLRKEKVVISAICQLSLESRWEILKKYGKDDLGGDIIDELIGEDCEIYKRLLESSELKPIHLIPLRGRPIGNWVERAQLALQSGYSEEDVVDESVSGVSWSVFNAPMWEEWENEYRVLEASSEGRLKEVGRIGREKAMRIRSEGEKAESKVAVRGRR